MSQIEFQDTIFAGDREFIVSTNIDEDKKIRNHTFIRMKKEEIDMEFMNEIKDYSHSEIFKSHFTIIVKIKSFNLL